MFHVCTKNHSIFLVTENLLGNKSYFDFKCVLCPESSESHTFFLHLALYIWVIDDFTQGNAAEQWTQETFSPAAAVRTVEDSHAEVTGEVGPLSKH